MRKILLILALLLVLPLAVYGGWHWWTSWRFLESTDDAYIESDISLISPKIEGYIKEVRVEDNQQVAAGQVLFVIDDRDFAAKVAQAESMVAAAEATVATDASRIVLQHAMIDQAAAATDAADADAAHTTADLKRYTALVSTSIASRQQFDTAEADARKAAAALVRARAAQVAAQNQLAVYRSQ
jgi:membrane fusion protein, multidrug efflux system